MQKYLIPLIFQIDYLSKMVQSVHYTKHHGVALIAVCQHDLCQTWPILACHLFLRWPKPHGKLKNEYCAMLWACNPEKCTMLILLVCTVKKCLRLLRTGANSICNVERLSFHIYITRVQCVFDDRCRYLFQNVKFRNAFGQATFFSTYRLCKDQAILMCYGSWKNIK